uniref:Cytochrome P450 3A11 n=2 Tax=Araneus ventricosus TaxID=182803 RepID=A0A4Y2RMZ6_ARAVE|nr:Cytochrome P450 3A11 [Araneus ventricosus]
MSDEHSTKTNTGYQKNRILISVTARTLHRFLMESKRMFTNRYALEDVQYGDIHIPKGTLIQAPVHLMHHDPDFWSEPEIFDPERFSNKPNTEGITYLPFGVGPRNCLGMRFAQLEAKLALANMVYRFNIKLDDKQKDNLEILCRIRTLTPAKVSVKLEPRNENN